MTQGQQRKPGITARPWWPWFKRAAMAAFFILLAWLLVTEARAVEWSKVLAVIGNYPLSALMGAVALAWSSLALYSTFDLLGRHYTGHTLSAPAVMRITFVSYLFSLNMGALVGGVALRFRLYSKLGLEPGTITRILSLSLLTNWTGYLLLAGFIYAFYTPALPPGWKIGSAGLQILGYALLATALLYLLLCAVSRQRSFTIRGHELNLPSLRLALLQVVVGAGNWLLMGGAVHMLLLQKIPFPTVTGVLLVAAVAAVITHVPAGLGVLETTFVVLLSHLLPRHELIAALLAYRGIYYLAPLALAVALYLLAETGARKAQSARLRKRT